MNLRVAVMIGIAGICLVGCSNGPAGGGSPATQATVSATPSPPPVSSADGDPLHDKGIGPITEVTLETVDPQLVEAGEKVFKAKCTACHRIDKRRVGPALGGVTDRRSPEWIMNLLMNTPEMLKKDPVAKQLVAEYATQMADLKLSETDARAVLEFLRTKADDRSDTH